MSFFIIERVKDATMFYFSNPIRNLHSTTKPLQSTGPSETLYEMSADFVWNEWCMILWGRIGVMQQHTLQLV